MAFSPSTYLTSQGWSGPGNGLQKGGIKKPVTVAHKTNLKGIGKERDTGYAWWDDVFALVANKGKGGQAKDLKRTSTGIYSHLAPSTSGTATPVDLDTLPSNGTPSSSSAFHTDIIGQAKLEATRREFYSKFLRGRTLEGSYDSTQEEQEKTPAPVQEEQGQDKAELKRLKKERKEERARRRAQKASIQGQSAASGSEQPGAGPSQGAVALKQKKNKRQSSTEENNEVLQAEPADVEDGLHAPAKSEKRKKRKREKEGIETTDVHEEAVLDKLEAPRPQADEERRRRKALEEP